MEVESLNNNNDQNFYKSRTLAVLQKWGVEGEMNEMNEMNVRNAASSYARIQVKNRILKWVTIGAVAFMFIFMALMIASVVIGTEVTKDFKLDNNQVLISSSGSSNALKTSTVMYSNKLRLSMTLADVQGIRSVKFETYTPSGQLEIIEFDVVSFYYSRGRNLTLYGHTHMATVMTDNSVVLVPITSTNGMKRFETSKKRMCTDGTANSDNQGSNSVGPTYINTCEDLLNLDENGNYAIANSSLSCTLNGPLNPFAGTLDGQNNIITINMASSGPVALFTILQTGATIKNVNIQGNFNGLFKCASIAVVSQTGVTIDTCSVHGNITCSQRPSDVSGQVFVGGFIAIIYQPANVSNNAITFQYSISQVSIQIVSSQPSNVLIGGFFSIALDNIVTNYYSNTAAAYVPNIQNGYNVEVFGYVAQSSSKKGTVYALRSPSTCCDDGNPNDCIWGNITYLGFFPSNCYNIAVNGTSAEITKLENLCLYYYGNCSVVPQQCCCSWNIPYTFCINQCRKNQQNQAQQNGCINQCGISYNCKKKSFDGKSSSENKRYTCQYDKKRNGIKSTQSIPVLNFADIPPIYAVQRTCN